jgi:hypothetical protein
MASEELPVPQEALEAVKRVLGSSGGYRDEDGYAYIPRDAEAAIRAAFEAMGMKVERRPGIGNMTTTTPTPPQQRYVSDWHPVEQDR